MKKATSKPPRLTILERRAAAACEQIAIGELPFFTVIWKKASMGKTAAIWISGVKCAIAGGYGYDKISTVIAIFLDPLVPGIARFYGTGLSHLTGQLRARGWALKQLSFSPHEDAFHISRCEPVPLTGY
jgi:hypothetical protein